MREASFILPALTAYGRETTTEDYYAFAQAIASARSECLEAFGGLTVTQGRGYWRNEATGRDVEEPVEIYTVAADGTYDDDHALHRIAYTAAQRMKQVAVYVRDFDGHVRIWSVADMPTSGIFSD
jgi:hypothetical protein